MKCAILAALLLFATSHLTATPEQTDKANSRETKLVVSTMVGSAAAAVIALMWRDISFTGLLSAAIFAHARDRMGVSMDFSDFERQNVGILLATPPLAASYAWYQKAQLRKEQKATTRLKSKEQS